MLINLNLSIINKSPYFTIPANRNKLFKKPPKINQKITKNPPQSLTPPTTTPRGVQGSRRPEEPEPGPEGDDCHRRLERRRQEVLGDGLEQAEEREVRGLRREFPAGAQV